MKKGLRVVCSLKATAVGGSWICYLGRQGASEGCFGGQWRAWFLKICLLATQLWNQGSSSVEGVPVAAEGGETGGVTPSPGMPQAERAAPPVALCWMAASTDGPEGLAAKVLLSALRSCPVQLQLHADLVSSEHPHLALGRSRQGATGPCVPSSGDGSEPRLQVLRLCVPWVLSQFKRGTSSRGASVCSRVHPCRLFSSPRGSWLNIPSCWKPLASMPAASDTWKGLACLALKWSQQGAAASGVCAHLDSGRDPCGRGLGE